MVELAKAAGFNAVFSQNPGSVSNHIDLYSIPREPILGVNWSTIEHFSTVLNRVAVSGREKKTGRTAIRFWLLVNESSLELPQN